MFEGMQKKNRYQNKEWVNPKVKEVLQIIGLVGVVSASFVIPALPAALKPIMDYRRKKEFEKQKKLWGKYNPYILKQIIRRFQEQKVVELLEEGDEVVIKITQKGQEKLLKYRLDDLKIREQVWDKKWRLIIYDVPTRKKIQRDLIRRFLKKMNIFQLQKSVYLTPYDCALEIEYLREYFGVREEMIYLTVEKIENEQAYINFFGL